MPSLGAILSEVPDEPYGAENYDDIAIRQTVKTVQSYLD